MSSTGPRISVVVTVFNGERFLAECLESIQNQTHPPDEVVAVNDGSTDGSRAVLSSWEHLVRVVDQENRGVGGAANRGIRESRGDYVAFCAQDDVWVPDKLAWQYQTLRANPFIDIAFGHMRAFGLSDNDYRRPPGLGVLSLSELRTVQFKENTLAAPTAVIRRALFDRIGGFREDLPAEDLEFWFRSIRARAVFFYDERLMVHYRQHAGNLSRRRLTTAEMAYKVKCEYASDLSDQRFARSVLARDLRIIGGLRRARGDAAGARRAYAEAVRIRPSLPAASLALYLRGLDLASALTGRPLTNRAG